MTNFLPNIFGLLRPGKAYLFAVAAACGGFAAQAQADLQLTSLSLNPGDEKQFSFSYNITNAGNQPVSGYAITLTFSADQTLNGLDYFKIQLPADPATQSINAGQSATRNVQFQAAAVSDYLPSGNCTFRVADCPALIDCVAGSAGSWILK